MRDINRIDDFCKKLAEYWKMYPDYRFFQMIINVLDGTNMDPWFLEEDQALKLFEEHFKRYRKKGE